MGIMRHVAIANLALVVLLTSRTAVGIGWDRDDFIVAGTESNSIGIFDSDFTFKGYLDQDFPAVASLTFDEKGQLIAAGGYAELRVYESDGSIVAGFSNLDIGNPVTLTVGSNGNYLIANSDVRGIGLSGLIEIMPTGTTVRQIVAEPFSALALLPDGMLLGGNGLNTFVRGDMYLNKYDVTTGQNIGPFPLSTELRSIYALFYSATTDTMLIMDGRSEKIYETLTDGEVIRSFHAGLNSASFGLTTGPDGDIYATGDIPDAVGHWNHDGDLIAYIRVSEYIDRPYGMVWAGNSIPEPQTHVLAAICIVGLFLLRSPSKSK